MTHPTGDPAVDSKRRQQGPAKGRITAGDLVPVEGGMWLIDYVGESGVPSLKVCGDEAEARVFVEQLRSKHCWYKVWPLG